MMHLTSEQLSAHLDGALPGGSAEEAERHLAGCQTCRDSLAALAAQDDQLRPALTHDPGEPYFEDFSARVAERIQARKGAEASGGFDLGRLFQSPRSLAWVGTAAVMVVGAGVVLMTSRHVETPDLRDHDLAARSEQAAERPAAPSPPPAEMNPRQRPAANEAERDAAKLRRDRAAKAVPAPAPAVAKKQAPPVVATIPAKQVLPPAGKKLAGADDQRAAAGGRFAPPPPPASPVSRAQSKDAPASRAIQAPQVSRESKPATTGRATEVRTNQAGEPVRAPARASVPPAATAKERLDQVRKKVVAEPLQKSLADRGARQESGKSESDRLGLAPPPAAPPAAQSPAPQASGSLSPSSDASSEGRLCGEVLDEAGRPIPGATVELAAPRRGTMTDLHGAFCLEAPAGERRLIVMAVGFSSATRTVQAGGAERLHIQMATVPVLRKPLEPVRPAPAPAARPPGGPYLPASDPYVTLPDAQRSVVRSAQQLQLNAEARRSAKLYDDAAGQWQRVLKMLDGQPLELETRWRLAETRFHAWEREPNPRRQTAALEALTAYAIRAPAGPARERAARLLDRIKN